LVTIKDRSIHASNERFCVSTRKQYSDGSMAWSFHSSHLVSYQLSTNQMHYLGHFLCSMRASERLHLGVAWKRLKEIGVRRLYDGFLQGSQNFLKTILARNFRCNSFALQRNVLPFQPSLVSFEMMRHVAWLSTYKRGKGGEILGRREQRIPLEFICFCSSRMVVSSHLLHRNLQRIFFAKILKKVLLRFLPPRQAPWI